MTSRRLAQTEDQFQAVLYSGDVLIRWGDPVLPGAPAFDPNNQTAAAQLQQFGYNNDYLGYVPLPFGSNNSSHGLLCVNHEYTNEEIMFPGLGMQDADNEFAGMTKELVDIEMAAHGGSIIEVQRGDDGKWAVVADSPFARRINMLETEMELSGPAAGHDRLKTSVDPSGARANGSHRGVTVGLPAMFFLIIRCQGKGLLGCPVYKNIEKTRLWDALPNLINAP